METSPWTTILTFLLENHQELVQSLLDADIVNSFAARLSKQQWQKQT
jgi:hypothetical protein